MEKDKRIAGLYSQSGWRGFISQPQYKLEIRSTKPETILNDQNGNDRNEMMTSPQGFF